MGSIHRTYQQVWCRVCGSMFCCKECRNKHEDNEHRLKHPDCPVCQYAVIPISFTQVGWKLRKHMMESHFPMHCVNCGVIFKSIESIADHDFKCHRMQRRDEPIEGQLSKEALPKETPLRVQEPVAVGAYQSPDTVGIEMTTSTPTTENQVLIQVPENITPVDNDRVDLSTTTKTEKNTTTKRVTFMMTPAPEYVKKKRKNHETLLKSSLKNSSLKNSSLKNSKRNGSTSLFMSQSAMDVTTSFASAKDNISTESNNVTKTKPARLSHSMNDTMWMSAINESFPLDASTNTVDGDDYSEASIQDVGTSTESTASKETGVWASMTSMFRSVVKSFNASHMPNDSLKRSRSMTDFELDESVIKRRKLYDIRCRPPIRPSSKRITPRVNQSSQTDLS